MGKKEYVKMQSIIFFTILLLFENSIFAQTASAASDFNFEVRDGTITVTDLFRRGSAREVVIPARINNIPVTAIGDDAFRDSNLINVTIPNSVTHIEDLAFADNRLSTLTIGNNVTSIGVRAFVNNPLTRITFMGNSTRWHISAFSGTEM